MSSALKALAAAHTRKPPRPGGVETSVVAWGKQGNWQMGALGYKFGSDLMPTPTGLPVQDLQEVAVGYGQMVGRFANGRVAVWGLNRGDTLPWAIGPAHKPWVGLWEYRTNLIPQTKLEEGKHAAFVWGELSAEISEGGGAKTTLPVKALPAAIPSGTTFTLTTGTEVSHQQWTTTEEAAKGATTVKVASQTPNAKYSSGTGLGQIFTRAQIETKERTFAWGTYERTDKLKALEGQVVFLKDFIAIIEGGTWKALKDNVGIKPGTDPTVWEAVTGTDEVGLLERPAKNSAGFVWYPVAYNLAKYHVGPQITSAVQISQMSGHGAVVNEDGTVEMWGRITGYSAGGIGANPTWGKQGERPEREVKKVSKFHGHLSACELSAPLSTSAEITQLPVKPLTDPIKFGVPLRVNDGAGHVQTFTVSADTAIGATQVPVVKSKPTFAFPENSKVGSRHIDQLTTVGEKHHKTEPGASYSQAAAIGARIVLPDATEPWDELWDWTNIRGFLPEGTTILAIEDEPSVTSTATELGTLTLAFGPEKLLQVNCTALSKKVNLGDIVQVDDGAGHKQNLEVTANATAGSTQFFVKSFRPTFPFPVGAKVKQATGYEPERRKINRIELSSAALKPYGSGAANEKSRIGVKKPNKEQVFSQVTEGALQAAGWPSKVTLPAGFFAHKVIVASNGGKYPFAYALGDYEGKKRVVAWGANAAGVLGNADTIGGEHLQTLPGFVKDAAGTGILENIIDGDAGETFAAFIDSEHRVWVVGKTEEGQAAKDRGTEGNTNLPILVEGLPSTAGKRPVEVACAGNTAYARLEDGTVRAWGANRNGEAGVGALPAGGGEGLEPRWKASHLYTAGEKAYYLGYNYKAKAAVSSTTPPSEDATNWERLALVAVLTPTEVVGVTGCHAMTGGRSHALFASKEHAKVWACGSNGTGQIGNGKSGKVDKDPDHGVPYEVNLEGRVPYAVGAGEWTSACLVEGHTGVKAPATVRLIPFGEEEGEQRAKLGIRIRSTAGVTGWTAKQKRQKQWYEELELEEEIAAIKDELENGEPSVEEKGDLEEELEELEKIEAENEKGATTATGLTITEPSSGIVQFVWEPPGPLTPNAGFVFTLKNATEEAAKRWVEINVLTNGVWGSPQTYEYAF